MEAIFKFLPPIHHKLCSQKCNLFFDALKPRHRDSLLEVSGATGILGEFSRIYRHFKAVQIFPNNLVVYRCLESSS
jgi:hypothetical protein